jgi:hypothetical protein
MWVKEGNLEAMRRRTQRAVGLRPRTAYTGRQSAAGEADLCVVHLVRQANGLDAFSRFLTSYRRHPAGISHALAIVLKGFDDALATEPYRRLGADLSDHWLEVPDSGFDLGAYRQAAAALPYANLVFLNSFSVIRADRWLEIMWSIANESSVGAVGATGSWASRASHARWGLGLGGPYRRVFPDRAATNRIFARLSPPAAPPPADPLRRALHGTYAVIRYAAAFASFPSPHLRSNCLLIDRDVWLRVCVAAPPDKLEAYRFESGRRGMTARLKAMGLRVLVAGRDGHAYEPTEWPASRTFWQGGQENLLVEDNQTRAYLDADAQTRQVLSGYAWGPQADPAGTQLAEVT